MEKQSFSEHAKHSQLRTILDPMDDKNASHTGPDGRWKFIEIDGKGKRSRVKMTAQGSFALKMFGESELSQNKGKILYEIRSQQDAGNYFENCKMAKFCMKYAELFMQACNNSMQYLKRVLIMDSVNVWIHLYFR